MKTIKYILFILLITVSACLENTVPYPVVFGEFLSFDIEGKTQAAVIDAENQTITFDIEDSIDISKIKILGYSITENASLSPNINPIEDFSTPRKFTITTYQDYEWSIDVRYANAFVKNVTIDGQTEQPAIINNNTKTITLYVKNTVDLTNVSLLSFETSSGVSLSSDPLLITDFSKPVQTTLISQAGNESIWTIEVKYEKAVINKMTVEGQVSNTIINASTQTVTIFVDQDQVDLSKVSVLDFEALEGLTVSPDPKKITDFTTPVEITLTSKDGVETVWTVGIQYEKAYFEQIKLSQQLGEAFIDLLHQTVTIYVNKDADFSKLSVLELQLSEGAIATDDIKTFTDFSKKIETLLTSPTGKESLWTIEVKYDRAILAYELEGQVSSQINYDENKIEVLVPVNTDLKNLRVSNIELQKGAVSSPDISTFTDFSTPPVSYITTATGAIEEWTIEVKYDYALFELEIEGQVSGYLKNKTGYIDIFMPQGTNLSNLRVSKATMQEGATSSPDLSSLTDFSKEQKVTVTSAAGNNEIWTIRVLEATQVPFANMEQWWDKSFKVLWNTKHYYLPGSDEHTPWCSGDVGAYYNSSAPNSVKQVKEGTNSHAHLETKTVVGIIAAGSLFTGEMIDNGMDPLTDFGIPFKSRPKAFKFKYKANPLKNDDYKDGYDMYCILQYRNGSQRYRLGTAWVRSFDVVENWTEIEIPIHYGELPADAPAYQIPTAENKYMPEVGYHTDADALPTHIAFIFSSSYNGNNKQGIKGSSLDLDDIELVY